MITYKILLTPTAKRVIDKTYIYYYSSNQIFADKWLSGIRSSIASLATMPKRCAYARENKDFQEEIRQLIASCKLDNRNLIINSTISIRLED